MARFFWLVWVLEVPAHCGMSGSAAMSGNMTAGMTCTLRRSWRSMTSRRPRAELQGHRQRRIPAPQTVAGAEPPLPLVVDGVLTAPDLEGDAGPSLEPDGEVDLRGGEGGLASWTT